MRLSQRLLQTGGLYEHAAWTLEGTDHTLKMIIIALLTGVCELRGFVH